VQRAQAFLDQGSTLADGSRLNREIVASRNRVARDYALDPKLFAALNGHRVHVDPVESNLLWAYRLRWEPIPVFQTYVAYTPALDERNADAFASPDGPDRVLRHNAGVIDGRNPAWESPAATRAMLCHFREQVVVGLWQVLGRVPNRCGAPHALGEVHAHFGESIAVPAPPGPRSMVYMRLLGVAPRGFERLVSAAYRSEDRFVTLDAARRVRLVPATAADGLIMRVPKAADMSASLRLDQDANGFVVTRGSGPQPDDEIRVRFYAVDIE
jgi:hypothetical protein